MATFSTSKSFGKFAELAAQDLEKQFPNSMKHIDNISIGKATESASGIANAAFKMGNAVKDSGVYINADTTTKSYYANEQRPAVRMEMADEVQQYVADSMDKLQNEGKTAEEAKKAVKDSMKTIMQFDPATKQYVMKSVVKGINDSLITQTQIPYWDIGFMNKIFKQPYTKSFAKEMVSVEGFGNAWADVVAVFKESFEGFGRVSNAAKGTIDMNNSNPVSNETGTIMSEIVNIAVDYETSMEELERAKAAGNWLAPQAMADRERYSKMVLDRLQDALIYFGNAEAGMVGLTGVNAMNDWATAGYTANGDPLTTILTGASTTKGADIVRAFVNMLSDFQAGLKYMPAEIKVACSTAVYKALTSAMYSDQFNPATPIKIISDNFMARGTAEIGGVKKCAFSIIADPMLDADSTFNTVGNGDDILIMTAPSIEGAMGEETGLVISPEPLNSFIVPPLYQRGGYLYTNYRRMGGLIVPIKDCVKVYHGVGVQ